MLFWLLWMSVSWGGGSEELKLQNSHLLQEIPKPFASVKSPLTASSDIQNFILQFERAPSIKTLNFLKEHFEVLSYVPDNALLIRGSLSTWWGLSLKARVYPYAASLKWGAGFEPASVFNSQDLQTVLVKVFNSQNLKSFLRYLTQQNIAVAEIQNTIIQITASRLQLQAVAERLEVESIQKVPSVEIFWFEETGPAVFQEEITGLENGIELIGFSAEGDFGQEGKNQILAVADTGFDLGRLRSNADVSSLFRGFSFFKERTWADPIGHGTHVTGLIAGTGFYSKGFLRGLAPASSIVVQSLYSEKDKSLRIPLDLKTLFAASAQEGAFIHSNSWGSTEHLGAYDLMAQQVDEFLYENPQHVVLFAAGNEGRDLNRDGRIDEGSIASPATAKNVLAVGASENLTSGGIQKPVSQWGAAAFSWPVDPIRSDRVSDNLNGLAMFSSRGPTQDGRLKPDLVAPGTNLLSLKSQHPHALVLWAPFDEHYAWGGGTSMATPLVAGAAARVRNMLQEKFGFTQPSGALIKAVLATTAKDLYPGQFGEGGEAQGQEILLRRPEVNQGFGRLDGSALRVFAGLLFDVTRGIQQEEIHEYKVDVKANGTLTATLLWYDPPSLLSATSQLVNNLDLVLVYPDGSEEEFKNAVDPFEFVLKRGLIQGSYLLRVKGSRVVIGSGGSQSYALVVTSE